MKWIGIKFCYHCDNFRLDVPFMAAGRTQDNVCKNQYQCTRSKGITVAVNLSHRNEIIEIEIPLQPASLPAKVEFFEEKARAEKRGGK